MKDITGLTVKQLRIFAQDELPTPSLFALPNLTAFRERFGWTDVTPLESQEVQFDHGTVTDDEGSIRVPTLQLGERRITLTVAGDSAAATRAFKSIQGFLCGLQDGTRTELEPVVLSEETACSVTLEFDWTALAAPAVVGFAQSSLREMCTHQKVTPDIAGLRFSFLIAYPEVPEHLRVHGITLAPKLVTIEPRVETPLESRRFFTHSPTGSAIHLELIRKLEIALGSSETEGTTSEKDGRKPRKRSV